MSGKGTLHLIPVGLGDDAPLSAWLPEDTRVLAARLDTYIAENAKTARAFLKLVGAEKPLRDITIHAIDASTSAATITAWLKPFQAGGEIGLVSEAGCPAVADPGANAARVAHELGMRVRPWVGPSSLLLGLMASGLNGQQFVFHGYPPKDGPSRARSLQQWERNSAQLSQTQLFIETPYRNAAMVDALLQALRPDTRLCLARALTTSDEWVCTKTIAEWRQTPLPDLGKHPTLFLFLAHGK